MNFDKILYRILLGYYYITIDNKEYKILYPTTDIKYQAEILFDKTVEENKFDKRFFTDSEIEAYLRVNEIWSSENQKILEENKKLLEGTKISLYLNYSNSTQRKAFKKQAKEISKKINKMLIDKNSMNYLGIKDHATSVKNEFIIIKTIYTLTNDLVFNNPETDYNNYQQLQTFIREIVDKSLDINILRELVRSETWRSYSGCANLQKDTHEINDDYRYLVALHKMYENVRQHPDCPSDEIIEDDEALDGWFLHQNKKLEKEKKKNSVLDKVRGNTKSAGEIFLMTDDLQETKDIFDLNDQNAKQNIKEMATLVKQQDNLNIKWEDLSFVQRDIRQKIQQMEDNKKTKR
jgi:hypothetical protein